MQRNKTFKWRTLTAAVWQDLAVWQELAVGRELIVVRVADHSVADVRKGVVDDHCLSNAFKKSYQRRDAHHLK